MPQAPISHEAQKHKLPLGERKEGELNKLGLIFPLPCNAGPLFKKWVSMAGLHPCAGFHLAQVFKWRDEVPGSPTEAGHCKPGRTPNKRSPCPGESHFQG